MIRRPPRSTQSRSSAASDVYKRQHEYEADYLGLLFMAMAGYNPNAAIEFWERMSAMGGSKPPEYLSTHPSDQNRIARIKKIMPDAMKYYKK